MMHPFANVGGLFDEDLESWQGQFGCSIESFEFYETDERRGFVRGAKWISDHSRIAAVTWPT